MADPIQRLVRALPQVRSWIEGLLETHGSRAVAVNTLRFPRLPDYFPELLLNEVRAVRVGLVPFPPVAAFGLPELSAVERMPMAGITYSDTLFVREGDCSESTCFHELVHVVQWDALGIDDFLLAYGASLLRYGYDKNPFEEMAYRLQHDFDRGNAIPATTDAIAAESRTIAASLASSWAPFCETTSGP